MLTPGDSANGSRSSGSLGAWGARMKYLLFKATFALARMTGSATNTRSSRDMAASDRVTPVLPAVVLRVDVYVFCACFIMES
jgi:hypothetical protein